MGWISGGTIIEEQVIGIYNKNLLTVDILDAIMKPFEDTDADTAGFYNLKADDGKDVYEIICMIMKPVEYNKICQETDLTDGFINTNKGYALWESIWNNRWKIH